MRILQIIPYFHPAYSFGGPVKVAYDISRELTRRGHEVVVYTSDAASLTQRLKTVTEEVNGIKIYHFRNLSMSLVKNSKLFVTPGLAERLKREINNFDIIHLHEYRTYQNIIAHRYAVKYEVPYVFQAHGGIPKIRRIGRKWLYDIFFGYKLLSEASKVIALTETEAEQYRKSGVTENKIEVIPNGINLSEYRFPPRGGFKTRHEIEGDEKVVLYLGRIHRSKGIDFLIKSFGILVKILKNVKLVLVGPDDGFLNEALSLSKKLKLESKILFTGFVSEEEKFEALVDANVLATPAFSGFPITFLEACIAGVPIVTTTLGDFLGGINGNVGFVASATCEDFSKALYKILSSNEMHEVFSRNCKDIVRKEFSIQKVASKLEDLYQSVIY